MVEIRNSKLYFKGRKDNQIKISGQLVVTDEVINNLEKEAKKFYKNRFTNIRFWIDVIYNENKNAIGMIAYHTAIDQDDATNI
jgi:surfactin family lipopeptide synthetase C